MKKPRWISLTAIFLCAVLTIAACKSENPNTDNQSSDPTDSSVSSGSVSKISKSDDNSSVSNNSANETESAEEILDAYEFGGVLYAVKNGKVLSSYANGTLENGETVTIDTPMPLGSVSKQFCATAILLLQEQGKLSVDDTLGKYYPEYENGKEITLENLLSMRSGVPDYSNDLYNVVSVDKTDEENTASVKEWLFAKRLNYSPGSVFAYSNSNYFLLANIVEQISGKRYIDFLRENIFSPLKMTHTGSIDELPSFPAWADGLTYKELDYQPGLTKGAGDLISNAADMTIWINALSSGKVLSDQSYKAMTTDYSPSMHYGYGLYVDFMGNGIGHPGSNGIYTSIDYINSDENMTLFLASNTTDTSSIQNLFFQLLEVLLK